MLAGTYRANRLNLEDLWKNDGCIMLKITYSDRKYKLNHSESFNFAP